MIYEATVITGKGRGKVLGFPTLNLAIPANFEAREGIYVCNILIGKTTYKGALHWGPIPVFNDSKKSLEIFVLDWDGAEKLEQVSFELLKYLRQVQNFGSIYDLSAQIAQDVQKIRASSA